ncbi:MAG: TMEM14 family protein [bacterium]
MTAYLIMVYGVLVLLGGIMGYVKSKSIPSVIMGSIFGVLILIGSWQMLKENVIGWGLVLGLSIFLTIFFGYRFWTSMKFMPAGLMILLSLISTVVLLLNRMK